LSSVNRRLTASLYSPGTHRRGVLISLEYAAYLAGHAGCTVGRSMTLPGIGTVDEVSQYPDAVARSAMRRIGSILSGHWRLDSLLGVGGSAAVYAATHKCGKRAAIKVLHPEYAFNEQLRLRLNREAHVLSVVDHPGAVRILKEGMSDDGALYLVMELLEGETLTNHLARKGSKLSEEQALRITLLVLDVLAQAHSKGIVHRDIKLDNVFITRSGEVKLLDFGIARVLKSVEAETEDQTRVGLVLGTPGSMPPEQALGLNDQVDAQSDVWAVGAVLFELLSSQSVHFEASTLYDKLLSAASKPAPKLATVVEDVSPGLALLVDRALAFEKEDRFRDATEMRDSVLALIDLALENEGRRRLKISFAPDDSGPKPAFSTEELSLGEELTCVWHPEHAALIRECALLLRPVVPARTPRIHSLRSALAAITTLCSSLFCVVRRAVRIQALRYQPWSPANRLKNGLGAFD
jgi:serine/threonine protein kinase